MTDWITKLLENPDLRRMGHGQRAADANLGLGWLYYALGRILRPSTIVVIGSFRGYVPLIFGKSLADNLEPGVVHFIDPSYVDAFWKDADAVRAHFASYGIDNIRHALMTTQQFVASDEYRALPPVDLLFVDGHHSEEQVRFDYESFQGRMSANGIILFHDSTVVETATIYGAAGRYEYGVKKFLDTLKQDPRLQIFDIPFAQGVTLLRRVDGAA